MDFTPPEGLSYRPAKPFASAVADSPLTPEHMVELEQANRRAKKIRRAVTVAMSDAWISAFFAAFCIASSCIDLATGVILGIALTIVAINSFRGAFALRRFDLKAPQLLAFNQIFLAVCIIIYAAFQLWITAYGKSSVVNMLAGNPGDDDTLRQLGVDTAQLRRTITLAVNAMYWALIFGTILFQGLTAFYYASRAKLLRDYHEKTPAWVTDLQRRTAAH